MNDDSSPQLIRAQWVRLIGLRVLHGAAIALCTFGSSVGITVSVSAQEHDLESAWARFDDATEELRERILDEVGRRVQESNDAALVALRDLVDRARKETRVVLTDLPEYYLPAEFAPDPRAGANERKLLLPDDPLAVERRNRFRPGDNSPPLPIEVWYDHASGRVVRSRKPLDTHDRLWSLLAGYPPDSDLFLAWVEKKLDQRREMRPLARHFSHLYADLDGRVYPDVTLYDALASREPMDMPDVDVIAFARKILDDNSYVSPIPGNSRRTKLYAEISDHFLEYFRYRTLLEALSLLWLDPDAELRPEHENLRTNVLVVLVGHDQDLDDLAKILKKCKNREDFLDEALRCTKAPGTFPAMDALKQQRLRSLWVVHQITVKVLQEFGML